MAKYRALQTIFWDDGFVADLTPEEKYFYIYLMTNSKTTQCGCYELPYKFAEMQTGYNRETIEKLIARFIDYGKIKYNKDTKEILILNWSKHNYTKSPKVKSCILKEVELVKCKEFREELYRICIDYGYPIDTVSIDLGEKEKEKEKEKEYIYSLVIEKLNDLANTSYRSTTKKTQSLIRARVEEGFTLEDFYKVIENKVTEWLGTEYEKYLRPETLFGTKFENYLNQKVKSKQEKTIKDDIDFYPNIDFETI